jgi:hypothetical protein
MEVAGEAIRERNRRQGEMADFVMIRASTASHAGNCPSAPVVTCRATLLPRPTLSAPTMTILSDVDFDLA